MGKNNKVFIMRGLPGSGKSEWAKELQKDIKLFENDEVNRLFDKDHFFEVYSADHFFIENGVYNYKKELASKAHEQCLRRFVREVTWSYYEAPQKQRVLVVDNTNISYEEMLPYIQIAKAYEYNVEVISIKSNPFIHGKRNIHDVPDTVLAVMDYRFKNAVIPKWVNMREIEADFPLQENLLK